MSRVNASSIFDGNYGTAQYDTGTTIKTLAVSIASGFILFAVQFIIFLFIRLHLWAKRIYQPRSFLVPSKNRINPPPNNPFKWISTVFTMSNSVVLRKSGMDGYFFLRYLSMCLKIFFPMALIILPILLPINISNGKDSKIINGVQYNVTGLDTLAWSNVSPDNTSRYWAHLVLAVAVIVWVCFIFHHELVHYIRKRQDYLSSAGHRLKASATSVLITDIPDMLCTVEKLTQHYDDFPGGLRRVWINRNFKPLVLKTQLRNQLENQLENAETNLIRKCVRKHRQNRQKQITKSGGKIDSSSLEEEEVAIEELTPKGSRLEPDKYTLPRRFTASETTTAEACQGDLQYDIDTKAAWTAYLSPNKRQKTRISSGHHTTLLKIPLIGRLFAIKVDTIYYSRRELAKLNVEIEAEMETSETYPQIHSAFLQFNTQKAAHLACQGLSHPFPNAMTKRTLELAPGDINWPNLGIPWWQRYLRLGGFLLLFVILLLVFGVISFITGILSKAGTLNSATPWLNWISHLPSWLTSFIQGTLPPIIIILLLSGPLPIFLRMFTNDIQGATTGTEGERSLQLWYLVFLLFELFIVPTIASGLTAAIKQLLNDPGSIASILATNLPTAANYYFSFLIVEALSISASSILQTVRLLNYYVLGSTNTPDSVFNSLTWTNRTRIGSNIPWYTTYAVIGLVYSVIAPLMLVFILITFSLFWFVIKNNVLYVVRTGNVDGGGLFFPEAINQTFTGLYFMEACLIGLFFLVRDTQDRVACEAQGIIMSVVLVLTIIYQYWLYSSLHPLFSYLPVTMESETSRGDKADDLKHLRADEIDEETATEGLANKPMTADSTGDPSEPSQESARLGFQNVAKEMQEPAYSSRAMATREIKGSPVNRPRTSTNISTTAGLQRAYDRAEDMKEQRQLDDKSVKRILARLNRPLDEARLSELEHQLVHVEHAIGDHLIPSEETVKQQMLNDPISKIIMQHNDELEDLDVEDRDLLISIAFTHPVLRETRPCVWIPHDNLGVSDDEVRRTRALSKEVIIDNKGATFDGRLKVRVDKPPPDMSEFALLMGEL